MHVLAFTKAQALYIVISTLCAIFTLAFPPSVSLLRLSLLSGVFLLSLHLVPAFGDFCFQFPPSGSLQSGAAYFPLLYFSTFAPNIAVYYIVRSVNFLLFHCVCLFLFRMLQVMLLSFSFPHHFHFFVASF